MTEPEVSIGASAPGTRTSDRLNDMVERLFGRPVPVRIRAWDGSESGPEEAPSVTVRSRRALRRLLWRPDELGLVRGYVAGELDVSGPLIDVLRQLFSFSRTEKISRRDSSDRKELLRTAVLLGAVGPQPKPPAEETGGPLPVISESVARKVLGPTLACSIGSYPEMLSRLGLRSGMRVLDIGCGWGGFLAYAGAAGIAGHGVTTDESQASVARSLVTDFDIAVSVQDWRDVEDGPYDAIVDSSLFSGRGAFSPAHALAVYRLLRAGGRFELEALERRRPLSDRGFRAAYLGASGALPRVGEVVSAFDAADLELLSVTGIRAEAAFAVQQWAGNLEANWEAILAESVPSQARLIRLLLSGSTLALESGTVGAHRLLATRPAD